MKRFFNSESNFVSVIVPTYKPNQFLFDCLHSLYHQTISHNNFEVIVVLNGEKFPYYEEINDYIKQLEKSNISLYYSAQKGVSFARNVGLENASGSGIVFIDDDDIISFSYLEELLSVWDNKSLVIANMKTFLDDISSTGADYVTRAYEKCKTNDHCTVFKASSFFSSACGKLIPTRAIGNIRFDLKMKRSEDSVFMVEIAENINSILIASESAIYYRRLREGSASRSNIPFKELLFTSLYEIKRYLSFCNCSIHHCNIIFIFFRILASIKNLTLATLKESSNHL